MMGGYRVVAQEHTVLSQAYSVTITSSGVGSQPGAADTHITGPF